MSNRMTIWGSLAVAASFVGCSQPNDPATQTIAVTKPDANYLLAERPANFQGVAEARKETQNDDEVTVEGRIGGMGKPFVDGIAAFTIIDTKLQWCADEEGCPTPWDYCCSDKTGKLVMVKVIGSDGQPVSKDARQLLGVKELSKVVVHGKAKRDAQGNLTVLADKVHVAAD